MATHKMYTLKCVDPNGKDAWFRFDTESGSVWTEYRSEARLFHSRREADNYRIAFGDCRNGFSAARIVVRHARDD